MPLVQQIADPHAGPQREVMFLSEGKHGGHGLAPALFLLLTEHGFYQFGFEQLLGIGYLHVLQEGLATGNEHYRTENSPNFTARHATLAPRRRDLSRLADSFRMHQGHVFRIGPEYVAFQPGAEELHDVDAHTHRASIKVCLKITHLFCQCDMLTLVL